jgi:hypothetical protein
MDETEGWRKVFSTCILCGDTSHELLPYFGEVEDFEDAIEVQLVQEFEREVEETGLKGLCEACVQKVEAPFKDRPHKGTLAEALIRFHGRFITDLSEMVDPAVREVLPDISVLINHSRFMRDEAEVVEALGRVGKPVAVYVVGAPYWGSRDEVYEDNEAFLVFGLDETQDSYTFGELGHCELVEQGPFANALDYAPDGSPLASS